MKSIVIILLTAFFLNEMIPKAITDRFDNLIEILRTIIFTQIINNKVFLAFITSYCNKWEELIKYNFIDRLYSSVTKSFRHSLTVYFHGLSVLPTQIVKLSTLLENIALINLFTLPTIPVGSNLHCPRFCNTIIVTYI